MREVIQPNSVTAPYVNMLEKCSPFRVRIICTISRREVATKYCFFLNFFKHPFYRKYVSLCAIILLYYAQVLCMEVSYTYGNQSPITTAVFFVHSITFRNLVIRDHRLVLILAYIDAPCAEHIQSRMQPCPTVSRCLERTVTDGVKP